MHITLSIDEKVVSEAREAAAAMGKSLNEVIRENLERLTRRHRRSQDLAEFLALSGQGNARDWRFKRDEVYGRDE